MRFCQAHQLGRTRRILAETQAAIEKKAARPKRSHKKREFEPWQERVAREWHERQQLNKDAQQGRNETAA